MANGLVHCCSLRYEMAAGSSWIFSASAMAAASLAKIVTSPSSCRSTRPGASSATAHRYLPAAGSVPSTRNIPGREGSVPASTVGAPPPVGVKESCGDLDQILPPRIPERRHQQLGRVGPIGHIERRQFLHCRAGLVAAAGEREQRPECEDASRWTSHHRISQPLANSSSISARRVAWSRSI